ncbi:MAG: phosphotransferase [Fibrobacteres bacterium]|nr:phosphotransferase [Fibrobacterota bacterium]
MGIKAFIPAAGLGTRLRPLTDHIPKPLLPALARPILDYVLDNLLELPIEKIGINLHHKGDQIKQWIGSTGYSGMVEFFNEEKILGTGGALANAKDFLKGGTFLVHNGDIISSIDLLSFYEAHLRRHGLITLAVDKTNTKEAFIGLDVSGNVCAVRDFGDKSAVKRWVAYTGIAFYEPRFLDFLPEGESDIRPYWIEAVKAGERITTFDIGGVSCNDLGTIDSYAAFVAKELQLRGEERYIAFGESIPVSSSIKGMCVIENGAIVEEKTTLENVILLSGAVVKSGEHVKNELRFGELHLPLNTFKKDKSIVRDPDTLSGGSNRVYTVVSLSDDMRGVLLKTPPDDPEFKRQIEYARFFRDNGVPVPRILYLDERRHRVLFEDLGRKDLYEIFHSTKDVKEMIPLYYSALDSLIAFQTVQSEGCQLLDSWHFDKKNLLWETSYFLNRFVKGFLGITKTDSKELHSELEKLAEKVDGYPKKVMHRDYQSRNIMVIGKDTHIVDFQGARMGPPAYDAASIIYDPYCPLSPEIEEDLVDYYIDKMIKKGKSTRVILRESLLYCGLQRHMQALGAYGLLSKTKGKEWFVQHIPRALFLLKREADLVKQEFPVLAELIKSLPEKN